MRMYYPSWLMIVMIKELKKIRSGGLYDLQGSLSLAYGILSGEGTQSLFVRKMCWYVWDVPQERQVVERPPRHIIIMLRCRH